MVACTPLGLPYQEGTDAPCEMSEIWCVFADVVEAFTIDMQNVVNRTAVGVPMAKVEKNVEETWVFNASAIEGQVIVWDAIIVDNDRMADLSIDNTRVFPRRAGLWDIIASVTFEPGAVQADIDLGVRYSVDNTSIDTTASVFLAPGPLNSTLTIHSRIEVTAADLAGPVTPSFSMAWFWAGFGATVDVTVLHADMHVIWTGEEVV